MRKRIYLYDAIRSNRRRVALGIAVFSLVVLAECLVFSLALLQERAVSRKNLATAACIAFGATASLPPLLGLWAVRRGRQAILNLFAGGDVGPEDRHKLDLTLEGVCIAAGVARPEVRVVEAEGVNALSLARGYEDGLGLLARGAVENLKRRELEAVLSHEVFHVTAHDTWIWMLALGVGALLPVSLDHYLLKMRSAFELEELPITFRFIGILFCVTCFFLVTWFILAIFWIPLWIAFFYLVIPRKRDNLADAHALLLTRDPEAVISAILKADLMRSEAVRYGAFFLNHMFFNQPLEPPRTLSRVIADFLNTHPTAREREEYLRAMG